MRAVAPDPYDAIEELSEAVDAIVSKLESCRDDPIDIALCIEEIQSHIEDILKLLARYQNEQGGHTDDDWDQ